MKKVFKNNTILRMFKLAFGGMLGVMAAQMVVVLFTLIFLGIGLLIITKFNKKDTKLFEDMTPMQYVGIVFCIIGLLPWGQYFMFGLLEGLGIKAFDEMFN